MSESFPDDVLNFIREQELKETPPPGSKSVRDYLAEYNDRYPKEKMTLNQMRVRLNRLVETDKLCKTSEKIVGHGAAAGAYYYYPVEKLGREKENSV